jgi:hypothetical protein
LLIGALANWNALTVWLWLAPGTPYVQGYLGNTTPLYAWPHVVLLVLSALAVFQVLVAPIVATQKNVASSLLRMDASPNDGVRRTVFPLALAAIGFWCIRMAVIALSSMPFLPWASLVVFAIYCIDNSLSLAADPRDGSGAAGPAPIPAAE